jgi:hypothetical protein
VGGHGVTGRVGAWWRDLGGEEGRGGGGGGFIRVCDEE